jgi:hypothetical protein
MGNFPSLFLCFVPAIQRHE